MERYMQQTSSWSRYMQHEITDLSTEPPHQDESWATISNFADGKLPGIADFVGDRRDGVLLRPHSPSRVSGRGLGGGSLG
jgi:hypothetical protein